MNETQLRQRIEEINRIVEPLIREKAQLEQQLVELKSPFAVGDVIQWNVGRKFKVGQIEGIRSWGGDSLMWVARVIRIDGSDGAQCNVYRYQNPKLVNATNQKP